MMQKWRAIYSVCSVLCVITATAQAAQKTSAQLVFDRAMGWFTLSEICQNSDATLSPSNIHRSMTLDISNILGVSFQQAETAADQAFSDYKKLNQTMEPAALKRARDFDQGSLVQMRVCAEAGFEAQQEFRQSLRVMKQPK